MRNTATRQRTASVAAGIAIVLAACGTPAFTDVEAPSAVITVDGTVAAARSGQVDSSQAVRQAAAQVRLQAIQQLRARETVESYTLRHNATQTRLQAIQQLRARETVESYTLRHNATQARLQAIQQLRAEQTVDAYATGAQRLTEIHQLRAAQSVTEWEQRWST